MASRWFRFYADALRHPKVVDLSDREFRLWVSLLSVAAENEGLIPPLETLKRLLKARLDHLSAGVERLLDSGLIDRKDAGYAPHNWNERQYKSDTSTDRVRKHREKRNVSRAVSETAPDTDTDTDTDTETEKRGVEDARAREPEPRPDQVGTQAEQGVVADEAAAFARAVRVALGSAPLSPNEWRRIDARVAAWIANGWPQVVVLDVIRERCANSRDPPRTLGYLEQVIAGEIAARSRPLPEVVALPAKTVHAAPAVRAYSVRDQAEQETRNALAKLREFATGGGPRGAADPRCLPHDPGE